jgi:SAM-dependent MidA family methyltransferase
LNVSALNSGDPALIEFIRAEIRTRGPVSFAWFMEQALYHPRHGYYSSGRASLGRKGDYFTNVSVGPLFGQLLAAQFLEMWQTLGKIDNFTIVEQGAHDGAFARDVLAAIGTGSPEFFSALRYRIIEPFRVWQDRQQKTLEAFRDKTEWRRELSSTREVSPHLNPLSAPPGRDPGEDAQRQVRVKDLKFAGVHFSNELLDAMPVHLLVSTDGGWREKFVAVEGDKFVFVEQPIIDLALKARISHLPAPPAGYETEINTAVLDWIDHLSSTLTRGYALAIDYGFPRQEFYAPDRTRGTLQMREKHRHLASPFQDIGNADISAHVNWTDVAERAEAKGLRVGGFTDQHHFITGIISEHPKLIEEEKARRALQTLLHPEMLGRAFQVLALNKDVDPATPLAGFKFARDAHAELGI